MIYNAGNRRLPHSFVPIRLSLLDVRTRLQSSGTASRRIPLLRVVFSERLAGSHEGGLRSRASLGHYHLPRSVARPLARSYTRGLAAQWTSLGPGTGTATSFSRSSQQHHAVFDRFLFFRESAGLLGVSSGCSDTESHGSRDGSGRFRLSSARR